MKITLKERLLRYLKNNPQWHNNGELQRLVSENTSYTPQNTGRRLRELVTEGSAEVKYERGVACYRASQAPVKDLQIEADIKWFDELPCCPLNCPGGKDYSIHCKTLHPDL